MAIRTRRLLAFSVAAAAMVGSGAFAQPAAVPGILASGSFVVAPEIAAVYDKYRVQPFWFRAGGDNAAVSKLVEILQRAPFDGFADGPQLAAQVQAAASQAAANPASVMDAEKLLSGAWVRYVQAIRRPTPGMIYAFPQLKPQGTNTDEIVLTTAAAPSLVKYLNETSRLNTVYSQLRDTAWAEAQASGNLTPDPRLLANLDRARSIPAKGKFALVDSGTQRLIMFEDSQPVDSMKVIVGTKDLPTPLIDSAIYYITYNPYWHAPDHLVRKTIAPTFLRQGVKYLKTRGYHVIDDWGENPNEIDPTTVDWKGAAAGDVHLRVRQDPGPLNSMGILKFPFPNPEDIYLHDTPGKELFNKNVRFLSNGCVRVEDARRFGRWLLGQDPAAPSDDPEIRVPLAQSVPIVLTYLTAQVVDGKITYLDDVYGWDRPDTSRIAAGN